jgi:hypothetical protein
VLKKHVITGALAATFAAAAAGAQTSSPATSGQDRPGSTTASDTRTTASTTLTGCVYKEEDVPGRTPNVAEQAGVMEDYILAVSDTKTSGSTAGTSGSSTAGTSGATSAAKKGKMFKLEHADDEKLSAVVGKRVEVTGKIDAEAGDSPTGTTGATTDRSVGPDQIDLAEFEVTSIREVSGDCPAKPAAQQ